MNGDQSFCDFFKTATGWSEPYGWQRQVAADGLPDVLPVPTGLGKTEVVLAWAWRLLVAKKDEPLHLVVCLPMRSLVTQTVQRLKGYFDKLRETGVCDVSVHQLMGGAIDEKWEGQPDKPWVLVGTQDQLLSRALNRGYAMSRFEWSVHFGLLNNDCRWLIDEVQLMGPGLWTTAQLDWMRQTRFKSLKPCATTWMSATVGTAFLNTTDRVREQLDKPSRAQVEFESKLEDSLDNDKNLQWWRQAKRPVKWWQPQTANAPVRGRGRANAATMLVTPDAIAQAVSHDHKAGTLSLIICNTVDMAREVFRILPTDIPKVLLTSRFRREDRKQHEQRLLEFDANRKANKLPQDDPGLICVSTQVIEAGVDISAHRLWTELAPWPSMLQRLGRMNRKGDDQEACARVWETPKEGGNKKAERIGPYETDEINRAKKLVDAFAPLSQNKTFSEAIVELNMNNNKVQVDEALQPKPSPLPRALDVHGLFSTERDVHGGFTDISAFVRGTDPDLDVTVFWRDWQGDAPPRGDELDGPLLEPATEGCPVSFVRVQKMLESSKGKAWLWDDEAERWVRVNHWDIRPGMLVMLKRDVGGYDTTEGWTGDKTHILASAPRAGRGEILRDDTLTEAGYWSRLQDHLNDARSEAEKLCNALALTGDMRAAIVEAAGFHDIGKAHPQWQGALPQWGELPGVPDGLLAKTPHILAVDIPKTGDLSKVHGEMKKLRPNAVQLFDQQSWRGKEIVRLRWVIEDKPSSTDRAALEKLADVCWAGEPAFNPKLRHEVASALAMWHKYRDSDSDNKPYPALAVYLAATHHGKARTVLRSTTGEGDDVFGVRGEPDTLEIGNDKWSLDFSIAKDGAEGRWEGNEFVLTGHGWTGLVADLLGPWRPEEKSDAGVVPESEPRHLGPFALAYLEALVRVADWRASEKPRASVRIGDVMEAMG
ncbi:type I-G CRISPR-associated helicase/endonuclease Cas3g [Thauera propionica]|jgi:CRISPR-associated endonuclease/helicase Cas3|uniref:type I-G CRISPR-associated helicase/endonuclease Cas3g n=1 Tax=Thauera propionica TaxID=2019431 RepID=UPI0023F13233|nr:DEAD/DEAH box helicase [Thauera propionica]MDD3677157.1 DEAD/DEAH box helicase [Thauera propionica]MDY0067516.1 DEAD/DEAH box helicase [Steroidobacteraceae bacterium]